MPRIVNRLTASEKADMPGDDGSVLPDHETTGIGLNLDRPANGAGGNGVFVGVEPDKAGLRNRCRRRVKAVEAAGNGHKLRTLLFKDLPDCLVRQLWMLVRLRESDALVQKPRVQLLVALHP